MPLLGTAVISVSAVGLTDSSGLFEFPLVFVRYGVGMSTRMHARVRRSVAERQPIDAAEQASITEFLTEFDRLDDALDQDLDPIHVTGSAIVTGPRGVLLLRHKRLGLWLQPGGHVDPGESPWEAALREAHEETGLSVSFTQFDPDGVPSLVHVDVHDGGRGHTHLDLRYVLDGGDADPDPPEGESQEIEWLDWPAAVDRASDDRLTGLLAHLATGVG